MMSILSDYSIRFNKFSWQRYNKTSRLSRVLRNFFLAGNQLFANFTLTISVAIVNFRVVISQKMSDE